MCINYIYIYIYRARRTDRHLQLLVAALIPTTYIDPSLSHAVFERYLTKYYDRFKYNCSEENPNLLLQYDSESLGIPNNLNCPSFCLFCEGMFNNTIRCLECSNLFHLKNGLCVTECGVHCYLDTDTNECFGMYIYTYIYIYIYIECDAACPVCYGTKDTDCTNCESLTETPFLCLVDIKNERGKCVQSCSGCTSQNHETYSTPNKCGCI